jgi:long-subunit fatty acid transport protein
MNNQFVFKEDKLQFAGEDYISNNPVLFYPAISAGSSSGNQWSAFLHLGVPAGGGSKEFLNGHPALKAQEEAVETVVNTQAAETLGPDNPVTTGSEITEGKVVGSSTYLSITLGGAYEVTPWLSLALGVRLVKGDEETTASGTYNLTLTEVGQSVSDLGMLPNPIVLNVNTTSSGTGFNPIIGIHLCPALGLNIALQYQFKTAMDWKRIFPTQDRDDGIQDVSRMFYPADSYQKDIPAIGTLGISYQLSANWRMETDFTYYFNRQAIWAYELHDATGDTTTVDLMEKYADGYETGLAIEYTLDDFIISLGVSYQKTGSTMESKSWLTGSLNTFSVGTGTTYRLTETFEFTAALFNVTYFSQTKNQGTEENLLNLTYNQAVFGGAIGLNVHF